MASAIVFKSHDKCAHELIDPATGVCNICNLVLDRLVSAGVSDYDDVKHQRKIVRVTKLYPSNIKLPYGNDIIARAEAISESITFKGNRKDRLAARRAECLLKALRENGIIHDPEQVTRLFGICKSKRSVGSMFSSIESGYRPPIDVAKRCCTHPGIQMMRAKGKNLGLSEEAIILMIFMIEIGLKYKPSAESPKYNLSKRKPATIAAGAINAYLHLNPTETIDAALYEEHITVSPPTIKEAKEEILRAYNSYTPV